MTDSFFSKNTSIYHLIYDTVGKIPFGKVATYGQISRIVGRCTPRMVGYALASLSPGSDVPWHRVVNAFGKISKRSNGQENDLQRQLLVAEKVSFDSSGKIDLTEFRWKVESTDII